MKNKISTKLAFLLLLFTLGIGLSSAGANAQSASHTRFRGNVAQAKFEMTLKRDGNTLSGNYFYVKSGSANALSLRGEIDRGGNFMLQEFDTTGKQTGEFKGRWKDEPNQSGVALEGEWRKPGAKDGLGYYANEQMVSFSGGAQIISRQINEPAKGKRFELAAEYPEITGNANAAGFNQLVKSRVAKALAEFRKDMRQALLPRGMDGYIDIGYNVEYADDNLISVIFMESTFTGGAHPNYGFFTITYDLKERRQVQFVDLFKPATYYLESISAYVTRDLHARKDPESGESLGLAQEGFDGAMPIPDNYRSWNLTRKGLMITFDPYAVGPYAAGSHTVIMPYANLKTLAASDGPIMKVMK